MSAVVIPEPPAWLGKAEIDPAGTERGEELHEQPTSRLFKTVWRWHFYAGLFVIPFVVVLAWSGIVYLLKPQILDLANGNLRNVATQRTTPVSYDQQFSAVKRDFPGATITSISPPPDGTRSTMFGVTTNAGHAVTVYVNPYTGAVLGQTDNQNQIPQIARDVHSSLLTARFWSYPGAFGPKGYGNYLMEAVACWAIVLLVTGVYLWWPRGPKRSLRSALSPRLRARSLRVRWRDLHAITGVMGSFVFLFLLVSGLFWTGVWGQKYQQVVTRLGAGYPAAVTDGIQSQPLGKIVGVQGTSWAGSEVPVPPSEYAAGKVPTAAALGPLQWDPRQGAPLDAVVAQTQERHMALGYTISFPYDNKGSYSVSRFPDSDVLPEQSAIGERNLFIDQYTGTVLGDVGFGQYGPLAKATDFAISVHQGREFGLTNQILLLVATLLLLFICASAVVMWRKRRPRGIGAPRRMPNRKLGAGVIAITFGLGALFPLLGSSIIALLIFDFTLVRRFPRLNRALGGA